MVAQGRRRPASACAAGSGSGCGAYSGVDSIQNRASLCRARYRLGPPIQTRIWRLRVWRKVRIECGWRSASAANPAEPFCWARGYSLRVGRQLCSDAIGVMSGRRKQEAGNHLSKAEATIRLANGRATAVNSAGDARHVAQQRSSTFTRQVLSESVNHLGQLVHTQGCECPAPVHTVHIDHCERGG